MSTEYKDWEVYERYVAELLVRDLPPEYCITANAQVTGRISGERRQIDVLIDVRHDTDNSRRIVLDAKRAREVAATHRTAGET
jgi:5-methylcytosine-specific restriction endonuclease McrBC regulatory subunit McrC